MLFSKRPRTRGEEAASSAIHGVAFILALVAIPFLVVSAQSIGWVYVASVSVFAASLATLYLASSLYHGFPDGVMKQRLKLFDHNAIYLLIAGSYSPFTLGVLEGWRGWLIFGLVWSMAVVGLVLKSTGRLKHRGASVALYIAMGWLMLFAIEPLSLQLPPESFFWLVTGGAVYTAGVFFYAAEQIPYGHAVWHVFVALGSACHVAAVLSYSAQSAG